MSLLCWTTKSDDFLSPQKSANFCMTDDKFFFADFIGRQSSPTLSSDIPFRAVVSAQCITRVQNLLNQTYVLVKQFIVIFYFLGKEAMPKRTKNYRKQRQPWLFSVAVFGSFQGPPLSRTRPFNDPVIFTLAATYLFQV